MSIVKYKGLEFNQEVQTPGYMDTVMIPIVAQSGPLTSYIYNLSEFYAKYNCDSDIGSLVGRLLNLNYKVLIYRLNYVDECSTIKIIDSDTYSYFDTNKSYQALSGTFISNKNLKSRDLVWNIDAVKFTPQELDPVLNDLDYGAFIFPERKGIIRIYPGQKPPGADDMTTFNIRRNIENACTKSKARIVSELKAILVESFDAIVDVTDLNIRVEFYNPTLIESNLKDTIFGDSKSTYDTIYSNGLEFNGVRFKSRDSDSLNDIRIRISHQSDTDFNLEVTRLNGRKGVYSETIYVSNDSDSSYSLSDMRSELIEYLDGEIATSMDGTYILGYNSPTEYNVYDYWNKFELDPNNYDPVFVILNPIKWDSEFNQSSIEVYIEKLSKLAQEFDTVLISSETFFKNTSITKNLLVVNPDVKDNVGTLTPEILLRNLSDNRMESDVEFTGGLDGSPVSTGENVATLEYDQYRYTFNQPSIYFQDKWITLSVYCGFISAGHFIKYYLDTNAIARLSNVDTDDLRSAILNKYAGLISDVELNGQKSGRKYKLSVSLYFETQTSQKLILIVNLVEE